MVPTQFDSDADMPDEIDFSAAQQGKFYHPNAQLQLPVHLESNVQSTLLELANARGMELSAFVNNLLKKDIELMQMGR